MHMTVGDLARQSPQLIPLFFEKGLEFCCGGAKRLEDACTEVGLDPAAFLTEIEAWSAGHSSPPVPSWSQSEMPQLIDYILDRFHAGHRRDFSLAAPMIDKVCRVHGGKKPYLAELKELFEAIVADIEPHMMKEEQILFPLLRNLAGETTAYTPRCASSPEGPIHVMRMEHHQVGAFLERMVEVTNAFTPPDDACETFRGTYALLANLNQEIRLHIHLENNVLFPMAEALASDTDAASGVDV
jgi:regulator of cell morphogenesis and NO signaling